MRDTAIIVTGFVHDDPGTEDELNAIEGLAEAMWHAESVSWAAGFDPFGWLLLEERVCQEYRERAERWRDARILEMAAAAERNAP